MSLAPTARAPFSRTIRGRFYCAGVSAAAVALAQVKTVLIEPLVYLRADELASWGLILRVPPRQRDGIPSNDADDRPTASPQVGVFHYAQACRKTEGKRYVAFRYK